MWIYTDTKYGDVILYKRKNCTVAIVGDEIVLTVVRPEICSQCIENVKELETYLKIRAKSEKVEAA